jgi:hypothetical protein
MTKLTLSVDEDVVQRAKRYAARRKTSVSRLVERYLELISRPPRLDAESMPPILARLRGVLKGGGRDEGDYRRYLEKKYR